MSLRICFQRTARYTVQLKTKEIIVVGPRTISTSAFWMAPIPKSIKAVEIDETGGTEVLKFRDVAAPVPKEGQVLVENEYIGINFIDT